MISTTNDYQRLQTRTQKIYIVISGCRPLLQSVEVSFFQLGVAESPTFAIRIIILPVMVQEI